MKRFGRLVALFAALAMLTMSFSAMAEGESKSFSVSIHDMQLIMGGQQMALDGVGLEIKGGLDASAKKTALTLDVLANNASALSAAMGMDEEGFKIVVSGLSSALFMSMDSIKQVIGAAETQINADALNMEAMLNNLMTLYSELMADPAVQAAAGRVMTALDSVSPVDAGSEEHTFLFDSYTAAKSTMTIESTQMDEIVGGVLDLLDALKANATLAPYMEKVDASALRASYEEKAAGKLQVVVETWEDESDHSDAQISVREAGEEQYFINYTADATADGAQQENALLLQNGNGDGVQLLVNQFPNEEVEGESVFSIALYQFDKDTPEGQYETALGLDVGSTMVTLEEGLTGPMQSVTAYCMQGDAVTFSAGLLMGSVGGRDLFQLNVATGEEGPTGTLQYLGARTEGVNATVDQGQFYAGVTFDGQEYAALTGITVTTGDNADYASVDTEGKTMIDVTKIDGDQMAQLQGEMMGVFSGLMGSLSAVPSVAALIK